MPVAHSRNGLRCPHCSSVKWQRSLRHGWRDFLRRLLAGFHGVAMCVGSAFICGNGPLADDHHTRSLRSLSPILNAYASVVSTDLREAKPMAIGRSKPLRPSPLGKKLRFRRTATASTSAPFPMCSYRMAPTSIPSSLKKACAGGIGSMSQENGIGGSRDRGTRDEKRVWTDPQPVPPRV